MVDYRYNALEAYVLYDLARYEYLSTAAYIASTTAVCLSGRYAVTRTCAVMGPTSARGSSLCRGGAKLTPIEPSRDPIGCLLDSHTYLSQAHAMRGLLRRAHHVMPV